MFNSYVSLPEGNGSGERENTSVNTVSTTEIHISILGLHGDVSKFRNMSWER